MTDSAVSDISLKEKAALLEEENRTLKKKIERIQKTMDITIRHGDFVAGELEEKVEASERFRLLSETLEEKTARLEEENRKLKKKIERLKKTMDITTRHGDVVAGELEEKVEASIKEIESHVRLISETIPVPVKITRMSDGRIMYVNEHSCRVFGISADEFIGGNASDLYGNPEDRKIFLKELSKQSRVSDFEVKMKKRDGSLLWVALFSQMMIFRSESCILTVIYDLTERKRAEEEIRRLNEKLDQKEDKYLIFRLEDTEYGIEILNVREIVTMIPITPVPNVPPYIKGVINLRGRVIPVTDLRLRLGLKASVCTDRTCIILIQTGDEKDQNMKGIIVDAVSGVCGIMHRDIDFPPALSTRMDFISGMVRTGSDIKILLDIRFLSRSQAPASRL
jgi:purine-binding chemotaxis protein CheW